MVCYMLCYLFRGGDLPYFNNNTIKQFLEKYSDDEAIYRNLRYAKSKMKLQELSHVNSIFYQ